MISNGFISNGFDEIKKKVADLQNTNVKLHVPKENQFLWQENSGGSNAPNQIKLAHDTRKIHNT